MDGMARGVISAALLLATALTAHATAPRVSVMRPAADTVTAMSGANTTKPLRTAATLRYGTAAPPMAWSKLAATGRWDAAWDAATGVPRRIWGSGIAAPGAMANPAIAEAVARQMLADHVALLAPGAAASDFVL